MLQGKQRLTPLEHPSSVSALRADPPSPARGEGKGGAACPVQWRLQEVGTPQIPFRWRSAGLVLRDEH
ncbi:hypothetical protein EN828_24140 [Mesorhizobium sp. M2D.F.Ca.ET.185.01.1.1]|nr:hypothetical protein EN783_22905 [Mesorhizobium sp. M2D.F.Ca.ET.140.01.1.1]TGP15423.1 hypothetical protein EN876_21515 [Mesorhizobium sp. M2D.F.Ca.ET.233.01.1.1]TGP30627.1 hypothetical protein EN875_025050 [Mesorhizobium sp. M2D.F.Ca.ET.232.01.1.1]TGP45524.1 hypothetical protein EN873_40635 [bacterium M00.F.Ca.ET.230.01.1.1]TGP56017.1 hypothetical protein EN869_024235 [Mesorhizobium sp. M2D.F.Ca.ET.226.01.1.1]TGP63999.1 hypothetical protein EN868_25990 [Mesorhizobium sp. M2D.F.Ca.ET.225.01.